MEDFDRSSHWENIYQTKALAEVSWYQSSPEISIELITKYAISKSAKIIDVGGGDSFLVDHLLNLGYTDVTVLDISKNAIDRAKKRLGLDAEKVNWIVSDITLFKPQRKYDLWHDRAAFHFLVESADIENYRQNIVQSLVPNGIAIIGTFSENGPTKCSGIEIKQYGESELADTFESDFDKIRCINVDHQTPFETTQNFNFCTLKKVN